MTYFNFVHSEIEHCLRLCSTLTNPKRIISFSFFVVSISIPSDETDLGHFATIMCVHECISLRKGRTTSAEPFLASTLLNLQRWPLPFSLTLALSFYSNYSLKSCDYKTKKNKINRKIFSKLICWALCWHQRIIYNDLTWRLFKFNEWTRKSSREYFGSRAAGNSFVLVTLSPCVCASHQCATISSDTHSLFIPNKD